MKILLYDEQVNKEKKLWGKETILNLMLYKNGIKCIIAFAVSTGTVRVRDYLLLYSTLP